MNEFSLLMAKLTNHSIDLNDNISKNIGGTSDELCDLLRFTGKYRKDQLVEKLLVFSAYLTPLGLRLRLNPFNKKWFIVSNAEIMEHIKKNPFEQYPRLGATLFTILSLYLLQNHEISIESIRSYRNKKDISQDLEDLERINLIQIEGEHILIHENLGYIIDFEHFIQILENLN